MATWQKILGSSPIPVASGNTSTDTYADRVENPPGTILDYVTPAGARTTQSLNAGTVSPTVLSYQNGLVPVFSSSISLPTPVVSNAGASLVTVNGVNGTSATASIALTGVPPANALMTFILNADASGQVVYTFSTHFRPTGTATVTASHTMVVEFISDGTNMIEKNRSVAVV